MNGMKRILALLLAACMIFALTACGQKAQEQPSAADPGPAAAPAENTASEPEAPAEQTEPKWLRLAESFAYPSLDAHKDYYGWYTSIYGVTETLFRVGHRTCGRGVFQRHARHGRYGHAKSPAPCRGQRALRLSYGLFLLS